MTARLGNFCGFAACAALLAYAYYAQHFLHLEPCPLCIFQRVGVFALGVVFLAAAARNTTPSANTPKRWKMHSGQGSRCRKYWA